MAEHISLSQFDLAVREAKFFHHEVLGLKLIYPALGLAEEAGEVASKVKKAFRDDDYPANPLTEVRREAICKELGDVLYYLISTAEDAGLSLEVVAETWLEKFAGRKERGTLGGDGDNR